MNVWFAITLLLPNVGNGMPWRPSLGPPPRPPGPPVAVMTDVINDLGVSLLDCYMEQPGNIAFSPTGLAFVLTALYEGSAGRTSRQIAQVLALPRDRRVTEIGLRDIHRRLRSYLNADAFLGGLTLNRDDIVLRPEYEDTLRFYGFDVGDQNNTTETGNVTTVMTTAAVAGQMSDDGSTTPGPMLMAGVTDSTASTSSQMMVTAPMPAVTSNATASVDLTTNPMAESITTSPGTASGMSDGTVNAMIAAISSVNGTAGSLTTASTASTAVNMESSSDSTTNSTGAVNAATVTPASTVPVGSTPSGALGNDSGMNNSQIVVNVTDTTTTVVTVASGQGMNNSAGNNSDAGNARSVGGTSTSNLNSTGNSTINDTEGSSGNSTVEIVTEAFALVDGNEGMNQSMGMVTNDENRIRKRSIGHQRFTNYPGDGIWIDDANGWLGYNPSGTLDDSIINEDMTDLQFLVNGCDPSTISTATYTAALPFAYIPSLRAFGVEFPLDDPRYNVILLVPTEGVTSRLLVRLLHGKTLRHIRASMRPTWVRATIPSFMLRGFITLTPYLQKLGIRDAFEPRAADLTPMSPDLGIYARDVQQSIGVNIRNYMRDRNDSTTTSTRSPYQRPENYLHTREPIPFTVDRPFLFFIVDTETSVALIAGRIDDPLNSRIV
ncbi:uncharacterized protein LOC107047716 [Diachasma alloeum]|uniref:uncharacterized protein LOC107047716 n=1 Tax=Diachasma alloeum TaxID=454923 RepID=UPI000738192F|nr:uncharacterized protein LOC107047716 [Diachasma alloeum]